MVKIRQNLVSSSIASKVTSGKGNKKTYLVIHETDNTNKSANADAHGRLQANGNSRQASWHYTIDDKEVVQSFTDDYICWHSGTSKYNSQGIGIEICVNSDGDYKKAVNNTVKLVKSLMKKHNIPLSRVIKHQDSSGKLCPRNLITGVKGITWNQFKNMVVNNSDIVIDNNTLSYGDTGDKVREYQKKLRDIGYEINVDGSFGNSMLSTVRKFQKDNGLKVDGFLGVITQARVNKLLDNKGDLTMSQYEELKKEINDLKKQLNNDRVVSPTFTNNWKWAEEKGFLDGSNPAHFITREQFSAVLQRYNNSNDLSPTAKNDLKELLEYLYKMNILSENHAEKVDKMPEFEVVNLLISIIKRHIMENDEK